MKIRTGFVSNSSSSSFIIHRGVMLNGDWDRIIQKLEAIVFQERTEDGYILSWGDSGETFDVQNNYLFVETYHAPVEVRELIAPYLEKAYNIHR